MKISKICLNDLVLYQDQDYILINKPPFIATLDDRISQQNILALAKLENPHAQVCHRLDKDTSGVLAIAQNPEAYRHLSLQFQNRKVNKTYHAVVEGNHSFDNELVDSPILKLTDGTVKISTEGKTAQTYFTTQLIYNGYSLVECQPITGRMHQIRVHLQWLNASIVGDDIYGGNPFYVSAIKKKFNLKKETDEQPLMKRAALHAYSLEFLTMSGKKIETKAPYPKDFQALLKQLAGNVHNGHRLYKISKNQ